MQAQEVINMNATRTRTPPKTLALARMRRLLERLEKAENQLLGFGIDDRLSEAKAALFSAHTELEQAPEDLKRKQKKRSLTEGAIYEIQEKYRHQYDRLAGGDATYCVLEHVVDDRNVAVVFENETHTVLKRSHLGTKQGN